MTDQVLSGLTPEEDAVLRKEGFEYTPLSGAPKPFDIRMRLAGAQIPVGTNIQKNKQEILKAIDWAKENEVHQLLTPEGSLSGWISGWEENIDEIKDALKEIEDHQKNAGIYLHLGTNFEEEEIWGTIRRNEIRHYRRDGQTVGQTFKTYTTDFETALGRDPERGEGITVIPLVEDYEGYIPVAAGLLCNDLWGYQESKQAPLTTLFKSMANPFIDLVLHATNGQKLKADDPQWSVFDQWHEAFFRMAAWNTNIPILTADSCTPWEWDGEGEVDTHVTSSQSGFITKDGWQTDVPRTGRQYFYADYKFPAKTYGVIG